MDVVKVLIEAGADVSPTRKFDSLVYAKYKKSYWEGRYSKEKDGYNLSKVRKYETIIKLIEEARAKQVIKNKTPSPSE